MFDPASSLPGVWKGFGTAPGHPIATVSAKFRSKDGSISGWLRVKTPDGETEYLRIQSDALLPSTTFVASEFYSDRPNKHAPSEIRITIDTETSTNTHIVGTYESQFASGGHFHFYPGGISTKFLFLFPFWTLTRLATLRAYFRRVFPGAYLLLVLTAILASASTFVPLRFTWIEALILACPLVLLFAGRINDFVQALVSRVKKVGPVEFDTQGTIAGTDAFSAAIAQLQEEFGSEAIFLAFLSANFVPHTKQLLALIGVQAAEVDSNSIQALARNAGAPDSDLSATVQALVRTGCIEMDDNGHYGITARGRQLVQFEQRLQALLRS